MTLARPLTPAAWRPPFGVPATWLPGRPVAVALPATSATAPRFSSPSSISAAPAPSAWPTIVMAARACAACNVGCPTAVAIICAICVCMAAISRCANSIAAADDLASDCAACDSVCRPDARPASRRAAASATIRPCSDVASRCDNSDVSAPRRWTSAP